MARKIKIHKGRWKDNKPSAYEISEVSSMNIDASFNSINEKLKSIRGMEPIDYQSIDSQMEKANELLEGVCYYIGETLDDIDAYIDTPFYDRFNHKTGILESFEKINLDNYKTKNVLGIKEHGSKQVYDYPNGRYKTEVYEEELEEIGFKDILSNLDVKGKPGMPSFAQMMEEQYRNAVESSELDVSYDDYVEALLHRSDIEHTVDKGWLNYVSDGLETIGVISFVGMITGENFITGEILTDKEREQAGLNTIVNVGVLLATIASAGGGSLAALGLKQGLIEGVKLGAKTLAVDMISGISGLATVNLLEAAGSPEYMAVLAGMGVSFLGGYCGEKYISKIGGLSTGGKNPIIDDLVKQTGLTAEQLEDVMKYTGMNADDLVAALKKGDLLDIIQGNNIDFGRINIDQYKDLKVDGFKPSNSPTIESWTKKGGTIDVNADGSIWKYTDMDGNIVNYRNGSPDFYSYKHPNVNPVAIEVAQPKSYPKDYKAANEVAGLGPNSNPPVYDINKPPKGYTWHHMEDGKTMILVKEDIHDLFKHKGGQSIINGLGGR